MICFAWHFRNILPTNSELHAASTIKSRSLLFYEMSLFRSYEFINAPSPFYVSKMRQFSLSSFAESSCIVLCLRLSFSPWHEICKILGFSSSILAKFVEVATWPLKFNLLPVSFMRLFMLLCSLMKLIASRRSIDQLLIYWLLI